MSASTPEGWRPVALRQLVQSTTVLGAPVVLFAVLFPWSQGAERLTSPSHAVMLLSFLLSTRVSSLGLSYRGSARAWVVLMAITSMSAVLTFGLAPAVLLASVLVVFSAGALLGRDALLMILAAMTVSLLGTGLCLHYGLVRPILPAFATDTVFDWARATVEFALVGGSAAVLLWQVVAHNEEQERLLAERVRLEALGRFAGGIAHDFNNALQVIVMSAELLEDHPDAEVMETGREVRDAAARGQALTRRLLSTDPSQEGEVTTFDVAATVEGWHASMGRLVPSDIRFVLETVGPAWVRGDELAVEQVLLNLVVNARDALGGTGQITLQVEPGAEQVRLRVLDDGPGIDPEVGSSLFEPFVSGSAQPGRGLGLSIVQAAVSRLGGEVRVRSRPGETVFEVSLPAVAAPRVVPPPPPSLPPSMSAPPRGTVLVADDDLAIRRSIAKGLRRAGWEVAEAGDGDEALDAVDRAAPDVLCTDGVMPGRPVSDLIRHYRGLRPDGRVVLCSGHLPQELAARSLGDVERLAKPFELSELVALLERPPEDR